MEQQTPRTARRSGGKGSARSAIGAEIHGRPRGGGTAPHRSHRPAPPRPAPLRSHRPAPLRTAAAPQSRALQANPA